MPVRMVLAFLLVVAMVASSRADAGSEDALIDELERSGLLAPQSTLDEHLTATVRRQLVETGISVEPGLRCRVLLSDKLESSTIGRTILLSRGLLAVLRTNRQLEIVLRHEVAKIANYSRRTAIKFAARASGTPITSVRAMPVVTPGSVRATGQP